MMKKEEVDYIMDIMFHDLVNFIQNELQIQSIPPDDKKLCSLIIGNPSLALCLKQRDFIGELIIDTILSLLTIMMLLLMSSWIRKKLVLCITIKHVSQLR